MKAFQGVKKTLYGTLVLLDRKIFFLEKIFARGHWDRMKNYLWNKYFSLSARFFCVGFHENMSFCCTHNQYLRSLTKTEYSTFNVRSRNKGSLISPSKSNSRQTKNAPSTCQQVKALTTFVPTPRRRKWTTVEMCSLVPITRTPRNRPIKTFSSLISSPSLRLMDHNNVTLGNKDYYYVITSVDCSFVMYQHFFKWTSERGEAERGGKTEIDGFCFVRLLSAVGSVLFLSDPSTRSERNHVRFIDSVGSENKH